MMEENKKPKHDEREFNRCVKKDKKKDNIQSWVLLVIFLGLLLFLLSFHIVTFTDSKTNNWDFAIVAKDHLSFSNTIVNVSELLKKYNEAVKEYNAKLFFVGKEDFDEILRRKGINPVLRNKLVERGIIVIKDNHTEDLK